MKGKSRDSGIGIMGLRSASNGGSLRCQLLCSRPLFSNSFPCSLPPVTGFRVYQSTEKGNLKLAIRFLIEGFPGEIPKPLDQLNLDH